MLKYLLITFVVIAFAAPTKAQTLRDNARENFIELMKSREHHTDKLILPKFKSGYGDLYDYLQTHTNYPEKAKKENLSAQVFVSFTVDWKTGLPKNVKLVQSSNKLFDQEALRLIKTMPAWAPGKIEGNATSLDVTIPIYFHLD